MDSPMERTVAELKKMIRFKDTTEVGDVVLMVNETGQEDAPFAVTYAVITDFVRDTAKRDEWWHVHFSFLTIPPAPQTIILQRPHFTGQEIFTMGGKNVFIKAVDFQTETAPDHGEPSPTERRRAGLRVVKG